LTAALWQISRGTDTAYVIVSATAIEDLLEKALLGKMRTLTRTAYADLFRGYGPLSTFSAKIDLAFALKIIDQESKTDFHIIREIRNKFAHAPRMAHFEKEDLQPVFQKLRGYKKGVDTQKLFDYHVVELAKIINPHADRSIFADALRGASRPETSPDKS
jgi:DNA-binding MltR family transcriptional regulator